MESATGINILLVEDNDADAELTIRGFSKMSKEARVFRVSDGVEATEFLLSKGRFGERLHEPLPKVIVLDLKMPRMGGTEVLKFIRGDEKLRSLPVVVLTSSGQESDIRECYSLGANGYVVKPIDLNQYLWIVRQLGEYWTDVNQTMS